MANDTNRFNNFDNLTYIEARTPQLLIGELQKIVKPAAIIATGPVENGIGFWAIIEIYAGGQEKRKRSGPRSTVKKTQETKTQILGEL